MVEWNEETAQYEIDGEPIDQETIVALMDEVVDNAIATFFAFMAGYSDETFDRQRWYDYVLEVVTHTFIYTYLLGRGGLNAMSQEDYDEIAAMVAFQVSYLDNFYQESVELSLAAIQARSALYFGAARIAFFTGLAAAVLSSGAYTEESWILDPLAEHCVDCVAFAAEGWQAIGRWSGTGVYPGSGHTECLGGCRCRLVYR